MGFNGYGRIWAAGLILFLMPFTSLCKHRKALFLMRNTHRSLCAVSACVHWRKKRTLIHWSDRMPGKHFTLPLNLTLNTMFYFIAMSLRDGQARNGTLRTGSSCVHYVYGNHHYPECVSAIDVISHRELFHQAFTYRLQSWLELNRCERVGQNRMFI